MPIVAPGRLPLGPPRKAARRRIPNPSMNTCVSRSAPARGTIGIVSEPFARRCALHTDLAARSSSRFSSPCSRPAAAERNLEAFASAGNLRRRNRRRGRRARARPDVPRAARPARGNALRLGRRGSAKLLDEEHPDPARYSPLRRRAPAGGHASRRAALPKRALSELRRYPARPIRARGAGRHGEGARPQDRRPLRVAGALRTRRHRATRASPKGSILGHQLEVGLGDTAVGAAPGLGNVFPARARRNAILRPALRFVVDETADHAHPLSVRTGIETLGRLHDVRQEDS